MSVKPISLATHAYVGNGNNVKMASADPAACTNSPKYFPSANSNCSDSALVSAAVACMPDGRSDSTSVASEACSSMPQSMLSGYGQSAPLSARSFGTYSLCGYVSSSHGGATSRQPPSHPHPHAQHLQQPPPYAKLECVRSSQPPLPQLLHHYAPPPPPPSRTRASIPSGLPSDPIAAAAAAAAAGADVGLAGSSSSSSSGVCADLLDCEGGMSLPLPRHGAAGTQTKFDWPLLATAASDAAAADAAVGDDSPNDCRTAELDAKSFPKDGGASSVGGSPAAVSADADAAAVAGMSSPAAAAVAGAGKAGGLGPRCDQTAAFGYCLGGGGGGGGGWRPQRRPCNRGFVCPGPAVPTVTVDVAGNAALTGGPGGGAAASAGGAAVPLAAAAMTGSGSDGPVPQTVRRGAVQRHGDPRGDLPARMLVTDAAYGNTYGGGRYGDRNAAAAIAADDDDDDDLAIMAGHRCGGSGAASRLRRLFAYDTCSGGGGGGSSGCWGLMPAVANDAVGFQLAASRQILPLRKAATVMTHQRKGADVAAATVAAHRRVSLADSDWDSLWPEEDQAVLEPLPDGRQQQQLTLTLTGGPLLDLPDGWEEAMMALGNTMPRRSLSPGLLDAAEWPERPCGAEAASAAAGAVAGGGGARGGGAWQRKLRTGLGGLLKGFTRCYTPREEGLGTRPGTAEK